MDIALTLHFTGTDVAANLATPLLLNSGQGADGAKVPTGYKFYPLYLAVESNAAVTAGSGVFAVTDDGTVIANGPTATIADGTQEACDVARPLESAGIAAGHAVGVTLTATSDFLPDGTGDMDAVLAGVLVKL